LEALCNNAAIGIVITNQQGAIINFNEHAAQQFGYSKEEIKGAPVELLIPAPCKHKHITYRDSFYHDAQTRMMGSGKDLYTKRKDNSEFPVEISLIP
jgi:PAS domain S-box-containing protein